MKRNEIITLNDHYYRVLQIKEESCLVIDCDGKSMPIWKPIETFWDASTITDEDLYTLMDFASVEDDMIVPERKKVMHERYTMIAPVLSFIGDENTRKELHIMYAEENL